MSSRDTILRVNHISKCFEIYAKPVHRLFQTLLVGTRKFYREFWALRDIDFSIQRGECVGIIGRNGAGKSTLLQIITGTLNPTSGSVDVHGRIAALLELGSGFNPEFTGRENVYMNAAILGLSQREINSQFQKIVDFADIGEFIDQPVKTYSSGMVARLAFAVVVHVTPEILIIDETLSVGDLLFQAKAIQKMRDLMSHATVLFVSHDINAIKSFCNKVIYLENGQISMVGSASEVCDHYIKDMQNLVTASNRLDAYIVNEPGAMEVQQTFPVEELIDPSFPESGMEFRSGSRLGEFIRADLLVNGEPRKELNFGENISLRLMVRANIDLLPGALVGYVVRDGNGVEIFGRNLYNDQKSLPSMPKSSIMEVRFDFRCLLQCGNYSIAIGFKAKPGIPDFYDYISIAKTFRVSQIPGNYVPGIVFVENRIQIREIPAGKTVGYQKN